MLQIQTVNVTISNNMTTLAKSTADFPDFSVNNFPQMPKAKKQITCDACSEMGFKNLDIAHSLGDCMRCVKCHIWRTCGQKKHAKVCTGKPPVIEIVVVENEVDESNDGRLVGREESDPDFVQDCRHFHGQRAYCQRGNICDFAHEIFGKSAKEVSGAKRRWADPCKYINSRGGCKNGDFCSFSHNNSGISAKEASGNITCLRCHGAHHIENCKATCGECGSNTHIAENCITCWNCDKRGHRIEDCKSACGYCEEFGHKQPQCRLKNTFCQDCKVNGHTKANHCWSCDAAPSGTGRCPCKQHISAAKPKFVAPK